MSHPRTGPTLAGLSLAGLALTVLACLLAACSWAAGPVDQAPHLLDRAGIIAEYRQETARLRLAGSDHWDPAPRELADPDPARPGSMRWEAGVGSQTAQFQWYCSWARAALAGRDPSGALAELARFSTMSVWDAMDDTGHRLFTRTLDQARRGNLRALARYRAGNC